MKVMQDRMNQPKYIEDIILVKRSTMELTSPFKDISVGLNMIQKEYPQYHDHTHWEVLVVMQGKICHNINGRECVLEKGDACLIRPTDKHSLFFPKGENRGYQQANIYFTIDFAKQLLGTFGCYESLLQEKEGIRFQLDSLDISALYDDILMAQNLSKDMYEMSSKLILSGILLKYLKRNIWYNPEFPKWLNEFIVYINNPINFDKPVKELVASTPYSYSRLTTLFKQYVGETLVDYLSEKKMRYVKRLLRTTELTTLEISEMIGYMSLSSLNHSFKKAYGITPSEYRKKKTE